MGNFQSKRYTLPATQKFKTETPTGLTNTHVFHSRILPNKTTRKAHKVRQVYQSTNGSSHKAEVTYISNKGWGKYINTDKNYS